MLLNLGFDITNQVDFYSGNERERTTYQYKVKHRLHRVRRHIHNTSGVRRLVAGLFVAWDDVQADAEAGAREGQGEEREEEPVACVGYARGGADCRIPHGRLRFSHSELVPFLRAPACALGDRSSAGCPMLTRFWA